MKTVDLSTISALGNPIALWLHHLLDGLMREPPGVLSVVRSLEPEGPAPCWYEEQINWRCGAGDRRIVATLPVGCFRAVMALLATQLMDSQFWGGESSRLLRHAGRQRGFAFEMSNRPATGYWLRVYVDLKAT